MRRASLVLLSAVLVGGVGAACGSTEISVFENGGDDAGFGGGADGGEQLPFGDSSFGEGSVGDAQGVTLRVDPPSTTVTVTGTIAAPVGTATFKAYLSNSPTAVTANWSLDNATLGSINAAGVFTSSGIGGKTKVYAQVGKQAATADLVVTVKLEEDFANLSAADKALLRAGGSADAANFKWLYPYDKTVFPRGLDAPKMQFGGAAPRAFYVHLKSAQLEYEGFYPGGTGAARVAVAAAWWKAVTTSAGPSDAVKVDVTKLAGATAVTGPISETWSIAQGSLKGTVFYNSYNSKLAAAAGFANGAVLRIKPGNPAAVFIGQAAVAGTNRNCVVCHSVSANGTTLVAGIEWGNDNGGNPLSSGTWDISAAGVPTVKYTDPEGRKTPFGALTADGKWLLGNGVVNGGQPIRGLSQEYPSRLYDVATGNPVNDTYFGGGTKHAVTPAFSPDGKLVAFSDRDASDGHTLGLLTFNGQVSPPVFGGYSVFATNPAKVLGWPSFFPDGKAALYHEGDSFDTGGYAAANQPLLIPRYSDLKWVDVATKTARTLDALNGWEPNGAGGIKTYLPYGEAQDGHMNYEPTVPPAPVGGYYWVVFTSRRSFGNTIYEGPNSLSPTGDKAFDNPDNSGKGYRKKLWVAAIDINAAPGTDPSHPAFYLEGQEGPAGNMRGFWALDPCKSNGIDCDTGDECCGGFCRQVSFADGGTGKQCVPPPTACSNDSEKCTTDADCCNVAFGSKCINGFCANPTPPPPK